MNYDYDYDYFYDYIPLRSYRSFAKGYGATLTSLVPFIAINFSTFDSLKAAVYPDPNTPQNSGVILGLGAVAGLAAQSLCFPLDTIRRRLQLSGTHYNGVR